MKYLSKPIKEINKLLKDKKIKPTDLLDEVYASIEANTEGMDRIGFIAHMDTAPDISGECVNPKFVENYDGKDILLYNLALVILSIIYLLTAEIVIYGRNRKILRNL